MAKNQNNNVAPATKKTGAEAKKDALATALAQIEKQFGKGAVMKLGDNTAMQFLVLRALVHMAVLIDDLHGCILL